MSVNVFGINATSVRDVHFPHWATFSADSSPTSTTVATIIDEAAGELEGELLAEGIAASGLTTTTAASYLWCAKTLRLMAAIEVMRASTMQDSKLLDKWEKQLAQRLKDLDENGALTLGIDNSDASGSDPDGPTDHISEYSLDIGDPSADGSDVIPPFRKKDLL